MFTYAYGFPRLGENREYKKFIEAFWKNKLTEEELTSQLLELEQKRISTYRSYIENFPLGEFTFYDNILDTALVFGIYRFRNLNQYYSYARGKHALELKKYFNTNYHYIVPEMSRHTKFSLQWNKPLIYFNNFFLFRDMPVFFIGPYTLIKLSRTKEKLDRLLNKLSEWYLRLFNELSREGIKIIHLEEPAFCFDTTQAEVKSILKTYRKILSANIKINLITYYESVDFLPKLYELPFSGIGLDFISGVDNLKILRKNRFPKGKKLICGIVDGKSPLRADIMGRIKFLEHIRKTARLSEEQIMISNSCPLFHLPVTIDNEKNLNLSIKNKLSFAKEKLYELHLIKEVSEGLVKEAENWSREVTEKSVKTTKKMFSVGSLSNTEFRKRKKLHKKFFNLPIFPTTTIGSFPQDLELRRMRRHYRRGLINQRQYDEFIKSRIKNLIAFQEKIGLDVFVHGEFERSDMVEFFAQKLKGFSTTERGWVISYGTRVYRPPIIHSTIQRVSPLTMKEIAFAQSLTSKPVKGIFTGPVTIIAWSYNLRRDPIYKIAFELAKSLNEEAKDLLKNKINFIQIDEPAIKEYAPIKRAKRNFYFSWAIKAFNMTAKLPPQAQIHTHMCYSDFGDIVDWILKMNFDVITIEAAREEAKIIDNFKRKKFYRQIGPGIWDIHSRYPANIKRMEEVLRKAIKIFGKENVWLNPDCGLKTRDWPEVTTSLKRMVKLAINYRRKATKVKK